MQIWLKSIGAGLAAALLTYFLWDVVQKETKPISYSVELALEARPLAETTIPFSYNRVLQMTEQRLEGMAFNFHLDRKENYRFNINVEDLEDTLVLQGLLNSTGRLQIRELYNAQELFPLLMKVTDWIDSTYQLPNAVDSRVKRDSMSDAVSSLLDSIESTEQESELSKLRDKEQFIQLSSPFINENAGSYFPPEIGHTWITDTSRVRSLFDRAEIKVHIPVDAVLYFGLPESYPNKSKKTSIPIYFVKTYNRKRALLENEDVVSASSDFNSYTGKSEVLFKFSSAGARIWQTMTAKNIQKPLAIIISENVISAPVVQSEISGGSVALSGDFTVDETKLLSTQIKSQVLPGKLHILSSSIKPGNGSPGSRRKLLAASIVFVLLTMGAYLVLNTLKTN